jgi:hypothetical protein
MKRGAEGKPTPMGPVLTEMRDSTVEAAPVKPERQIDLCEDPVGPVMFRYVAIYFKSLKMMVVSTKEPNRTA